MSHKFLWQCSQDRRSVLVICQAARYHYPARGNDRAVFQANAKTLRGTPNRFHLLVLQFPNESLLEFHTVRRKYFQRNGKANMGIRNSLLLAISLKGKSGAWIRKRGRKAFGLQMHTFGHVRPPRLHGIAENTKVDAVRFEMCSNRQSVRSRTYDYYITICHCYTLVPRRAV